MAKRKLPAPPKLWARLVDGRNWEIYLPSGETMRKIEDIEAADVSELARSLSVFRISYLSPVQDLTSDGAAMKGALSEVGAKVFEYNTVHLFESSDGTRAVVFDHHH